MLTVEEPVQYQPRPPAPKVDDVLQLWTTARCRRLLRPLVSRLASLRKDALTSSLTTGAISRACSKPPAVAPACGSSTGSDTGSEFIGRRKKRPRHTYSQRRGAQLAQSQTDSQDEARLGQTGLAGEATSAIGVKPVIKKPFKFIQSEGYRSSSSPGKLIAATPALRRARGQTVVSPAARVSKLDLSDSHQRRVRADSITQKSLDERPVRPRESLPARSGDLEGVYRALETLLQATALDSPDIPSSPRGPRSFLDMCLRKVPQYILELQAQERLDAEQSGTVSTLDNIDTSAQVYNHLESFGTNVGWRHLRVVVRADGLSAVRRAIEDGVINDDFSQLLIDLCVRSGAAAEAEELMTALVSRQYPRPTSTESCFTPLSALQPLLALNKFADKNNRASFLFRQYLKLLSSGNLPLDWLATKEFERAWNLAVQAIAKNTPDHDAINFLIDSIILLSIEKRALHGNLNTAQRDQGFVKARHRTRLSALAILASMAILGDTEIKAPSVSQSDHESITLIGNRLRYVLRACIHKLRGYGSGPHSRTLDFFHLAVFFSSGATACEDIRNRVRAGIGKLSSVVDETSLSARAASTRNHYDDIAWFIASIARDCSRGMSAATHKCLDGLFDRLESLQLGRHLLDNLKAAAAFLVAQQTNNMKDLIYAEKLQSNEGVSFSAASGHRSGKTLFTGYRWDDTIGEWVTVSPETKRRRMTATLKRTRSMQEFDAERVSARAARLTGLTPSQLRATETMQEKQGATSCHESDTVCIEDDTGIRKRLRRLPSKEGPSHATIVPAPEQTSKLRGNQLDSNKENRGSWLVKKPRRSSGRVALASRQPRRHSSGGVGGTLSQEVASSDDELCL
ncbi:hypothetical protein F5Y17DRAFT_445080 [Xylariaceae sp. FL0594]|nr:hypothetical protein F5Y17DRAFT_445080 [Xylariaceae sp. FL0594]